MRNDRNKYAQPSITFLNHTSAPFGGFGVKYERVLALFSALSEISLPPSSSPHKLPNRLVMHTS